MCIRDRYMGQEAKLIAKTSIIKPKRGQEVTGHEEILEFFPKGQNPTDYHIGTWHLRVSYVRSEESMLGSLRNPAHVAYHRDQEAYSRILEPLSHEREQSAVMKQDITMLRQEITSVRQEVTSIRQEITWLRFDPRGVNISKQSNEQSNWGDLSLRKDDLKESPTNKGMEDKLNLLENKVENLTKNLAEENKRLKSIIEEERTRGSKQQHTIELLMSQMNELKGQFERLAAETKRQDRALNTQQSTIQQIQDSSKSLRQELMENSRRFETQVDSKVAELQRSIRERQVLPSEENTKREQANEKQSSLRKEVADTSRAPKVEERDTRQGTKVEHNSATQQTAVKPSEVPRTIDGANINRGPRLDDNKPLESQKIPQTQQTSKLQQPQPLQQSQPPQQTQAPQQPQPTLLGQQPPQNPQLQQPKQVEKPQPSQQPGLLQQSQPLQPPQQPQSSISRKEIAPKESQIEPSVQADSFAQGPDQNIGIVYVNDDDQFYHFRDSCPKALGVGFPLDKTEAENYNLGACKYCGIRNN
eukprot:TRINITY_DN3325_c0_g2_i1.p1 TRINITY_DN3325_c0_g2~~TRINITY_DN3325_c0_g2_i1.p1  ORF type:complete len:552 (-),score=120.43 TRINITY_DN3325_c0_g2_i1:123-1712(-)